MRWDEIWYLFHDIMRTCILICIFCTPLLYIATEPFGSKTVTSLEPAKGIIFPTVNEDVDAGMDLYKKSHGSYGPGEQKSRGYTWKKDVNDMVFGVKGNLIAFNGVSQNVDDILKARGEEAPCVDTKTVSIYN